MQFLKRCMGRLSEALVHVHFRSGLNWAPEQLGSEPAPGHAVLNPYDGTVTPAAEDTSIRGHDELPDANWRLVASGR